MDDAANGIAVDGRVVPGVGAGGGLGGGGCGRGVVGLAVVEDQIQVFELVARLDEAGKGSLENICEKYKIRSEKQLRDWIKVYNCHEDFKTQSGEPHDEIKGNKPG